MGYFDFKIDGSLKQLQNEIRTVYASVPLNLQSKLNFDISILDSFDYSNPYAINQLGVLLSNLMFQKRSLCSIDEYRQSKHEERVLAENRWLEQRKKCDELALKKDNIDKDKNPDEYAAAEKELADAQFYRDDIYGRAMVDAVKRDNLNMLG